MGSSSDLIHHCGDDHVHVDMGVMPLDEARVFRAVIVLLCGGSDGRVGRRTDGLISRQTEKKMQHKPSNSKTVTDRP